MDGGFGLDNLPYGAVGDPARLAVRLADEAVLLAELDARGLLAPAGLPPGTLDGPVLNPLLALGPPAWSALRSTLQDVLADGPPQGTAVPLSEVEARLPFQVGDYVDFYSSLEHATNLGRMFRPDGDPLLPNWRHLPVGYHGRASSVVPSGTPVRRPRGQLPPAEAGGAPRFGPSERLDIELELGFVTGPGNALGTAIPAAEAAEHVFGFVLVNDWSARDIQRWEYQPLGPFLGKSFATSVSPWVVPLAALEPFRVPAPPQDPELLEYLRAPGDWALDIALEVELEGTVVSRGNARGLYWTFPQQLAHATINGTNVRPGDLYASGTISGAEPGTEGSLIELTRGGREPLPVAGGRTFLDDGDTVTIRGWCGDRDAPAISFGEVTGTILPAGG
ncbi:MAG TPA: fumarylacetoacetase [Solirubrobacteraceae bacterium]|nr:fumarylacetoacetase [Solirubrobacteraceae bacterium]